MSKVYSITFTDCYRDLTSFYEKAAIISGIPVCKSTKFDCRKIHVTPDTQDALIKYRGEIISETKYGFHKDDPYLWNEVVKEFAIFGPKADLIQSNDNNLPIFKYGFSLDDGFADNGSFLENAIVVAGNDILDNALEYGRDETKLLDMDITISFTPYCIPTIDVRKTYCSKYTINVAHEEKKL